MKALLLVLCIGALLAGCGGETWASPHGSSHGPDLDDSTVREEILAEAIAESDLVEREELRYVSDSQTPYTGWMKRMDKSGNVKVLGQYEDGVKDGLWMEWRRGQKHEQESYRDGKRIR